MAAPSKSKLLDGGARSGSSGSSGSGGSGLSDGESAATGNNMLLTAALIVADVVGAGILSMPVAVSQFGWLLGAVALLSFLAMNVHVSMLMWRVKMVHPHANTYRELAEAAFSRAPKWQRGSAVAVVFVTQQAALFASLAIYVLLAGKGMGMMFFESRVCLPQWEIAALVVMMPFLAAARKMGTMCSLVWLNILTVVGSFTIPLVYIVMLNNTHQSVEAVRPLDASRIVKGSALFCSAFTGQFLLVEIMSEMENPADLPTACLWVSAPFQAIAFMLTGVVGYCYIGDRVDSMIVEYLPFGPPFRAAALCLVVHVLISYLIKNVVFSMEIHRRVDGARADDTTLRSYLSWSVVVLGVAVLAWTIANVVPFFTDAMELIGAMCLPISCFIMPILCYVTTCNESEKGMRRIGVGEKLVLASELAISVVIVVYGTYTACLTIRRNWDTYGYPFECHCEGMWNTCACSSYHYGMDHCAAYPE